MVPIWLLGLLALLIIGLLCLVHYQRRNQVSNIHRLPQNYYAGLNYLFNEQPDKAVDVFIKLLQIDSDTVETHLALGSLFRRRGEVDRAIRIHQNLIARPQLTAQQHIEALIALGRDYLSAGVFDRAKRIFHDVVELSSEHINLCLNYLLDIYQQEKAWWQAIATAKKLAQTDAKEMQQVIAHCYCELAEQAAMKNHHREANSYLRRALATDKKSVRASLLQAQIAKTLGQYKVAIKAYQRVQHQDADFISEAIEPMIACYEQLDNQADCQLYLQETLQHYPRISIALALAKQIEKQHGIEAATDYVEQHLNHYPSIRGLHQLIKWHLYTAYGKVEAKLQILMDITHKLLSSKPIYRCSHCGFSGKNLLWLCPGCRRWNSVKPIHGLEGD